MNFERKLVLSIVFSIVIGVFIPTIAVAVNLQITDLDGFVVELRNAKIDYTVYSFLYRTDYEYSGIRVYQGEGTVTVKWERIEKVDFLENQTNTSSRLQAEVTLAGSQPRTLDLKTDSKRGLFGDTDLGNYYIRLDQIKSFVVVKETKTENKKTVAYPEITRVAGFKITDVKGNIIDFKKIEIDYTYYSFTYTNDFESNGIRVYQGKGILTLKWDLIHEITILGRKTEGSSQFLRAEVTFANSNEHRFFNLKLDSDKGLSGDTELGEYSVGLEQIKNIFVIKETQK